MGANIDSTHDHMTLYFLIFGELIGKRIGPMEGVSYMEFIAPGLIMMSVITNAYSNTVSSFYSAKFQGNLEEIMVAPVPHHVVIMGYMVGGICRGVLSGCLVAAVASFFISFQFEYAGVALMMLILTATLFSIAGILNALFANSFDDISIIPTFVLAFLTYLGGVFFPVNLLPEVWKMIASLNPIVYMVSAFRYGFLGFTSIDITMSLMLILVLCLFLFHHLPFI